MEPKLGDKSQFLERENTRLATRFFSDCRHIILCCTSLSTPGASSNLPYFFLSCGQRKKGLNSKLSTRFWSSQPNSNNTRFPEFYQTQTNRSWFLLDTYKIKWDGISRVYDPITKYHKNQSSEFGSWTNQKLLDFFNNFLYFWPACLIRVALKSVLSQLLIEMFLPNKKFFVNVHSNGVY